MFTGIGVGVLIGVVVFALVLLKGDLLTGIFTTDTDVIQKGYDYLKGFALETIVTAILFSMIGYFNGHDQTDVGNGTGTDPDIACSSSTGILHEYSAKCKSYKYRICSTGGNNFWNCLKYRILCVDE